LEFIGIDDDDDECGFVERFNGILSLLKIKFVK